MLMGLEIMITVFLFFFCIKIIILGFWLGLEKIH